MDKIKAPQKSDEVDFLISEALKCSQKIVGNEREWILEEDQLSEDWKAFKNERLSR